MDKQTALDKIKKCLNLSKSSNANESALALKQMKKLMDQYNISMLDIHESIVNEAKEKFGGKRYTTWKYTLSLIVAKAFDCQVLRSANGLKFIGLNCNAEIALYAYETLLKQLEADRKKYMDKNHKDLSRKSRNVISNTYCFGWLSTIENVVKNIVPKDDELQTIEKYVNNKYKIKKIQSKANVTEGECGKNARSQGLKDGSKANLFHATGGGRSQALISG